MNSAVSLLRKYMGNTFAVYGAGNEYLGHGRLARFKKDFVVGDDIHVAPEAVGTVDMCGAGGVATIFLKHFNPKENRSRKR